MSFGYTPYNRSFYRDINKLEPAHILIFDKNGIQKKRYWDLPKENISISYQDTVEETKRLLESSIKYRLISDLEVGTFLSGGIDSSLVSATMQEISPKRIKTFTIGFEDQNIMKHNLQRILPRIFKVITMSIYFNCKMY